MCVCVYIYIYTYTFVGARTAIRKKACVALLDDVPLTYQLLLRITYYYCIKIHIYYYYYYYYCCNTFVRPALHCWMMSLQIMRCDSAHLRYNDATAATATNDNDNNNITSNTSNSSSNSSTNNTNSNNSHNTTDNTSTNHNLILLLRS